MNRRSFLARTAGAAIALTVPGKLLDWTAGSAEAAAGSPYGSEAYAKAFERYIRFGVDALTADEKAVLGELNQHPSYGGFVLPDLWHEEFATALADASPMRSDPSVVAITTLTAEPLFVNGAARPLTAHTARRLTKVAYELLEDETIDLRKYLMRSTGQSLGMLENDSFEHGTGAGQPLGRRGARGYAIRDVGSRPLGDVVVVRLDGGFMDSLQRGLVVAHRTDGAPIR